MSKSMEVEKPPQVKPSRSGRGSVIGISAGFTLFVFICGLGLRGTQSPP